MPRELTAVSTADACRDLAAAGATGLLRVTHPRGEGEVGFERGRIVSAASPGTGARVGDRLVDAGLLDRDVLTEALDAQAELEPGRRPRLGRLLVAADLVTPDAVRRVVLDQVVDAIFELTTWERAEFGFLPARPHDTPEVPLSVAVDQLLVEVARRRDDWEALARVIPDLGAVPRFREATSASTASLEPDEFAVLASVDGERTIRELAQDLGYGELEAARIVYALLLLGLIEVTRPVDEIGAALDDALSYEPPDDAWDEPGPPAARDPEGAPGPWDAPDTWADPPPGGSAEADTAGPAPDPRVGGAPPQASEPAPDRQLGAATQDAVGSAPDRQLGAATQDAVGSAPDAVRDDSDPGPPPADDDPARWAVEHEGRPLPAAPGAGSPDDRAGDADPSGSGDAPDDGGARDLSAFAELRAFTAGTPLDEATPPPPATPTPANHDPRPDAAADPGDDDAGSAPPRAPRPSPEGDVSEFLRELSRLALDEGGGDDAPQSPPGADGPSRRPTPRPAPQREEPRRRRRLFGRGD
jgi:hypothetical protein